MKTFIDKIKTYYFILLTILFISICINDLFLLSKISITRYNRNFEVFSDIKQIVINPKNDINEGVLFSKSKIVKVTKIKDPFSIEKEAYILKIEYKK